MAFNILNSGKVLFKLSITINRLFCDIKVLNFTNKALYGPVSKKTKTSLNKIDNNELNLKTENISKKDDLSSEMYWLLQHKQCVDFSKPVKKTKSTIKRTTNNCVIKKSKQLPNNLVKYKDILEPNCKNNLQLKPVNDVCEMHNNILPVKTTPIKIPFSDEQLRKLLSYPLSSSMADLKNIQTDFENVEKDDIKTLPSVSKILQATMPEASRKALIQWKLQKISELGEQGFMELQKYHLTTGTSFHSNLHNFFQTNLQPENLEPPVAELWRSVSRALDLVNPNPDLCEAPIMHPHLKYKGIVDCVSSINNDLAIIEWKKSDRQKVGITSTYDAPIQLCAYLGAINADSRYNLKITKGMIVVAYTDGKPAHCHQLDSALLRKYWRAWLFRLQEFWIRSKDDTLPEPI